MIKFTTILHDKRVELDISMLEYVVLDTIEKLSKPKFRAHRKTLAEFIGMSRSGLIKAINRLVEKGLLIRVNDKELAVTQKWIDETIKCQQSVQQVSTKCTASVDKVDSQQQDRTNELEYTEEPLWLSKAKPEYLDFCKEYYEMLEFHGKINKNTQWKTKTWYTAVRLMVEADNISFSEVQSSILFLSKALSDKYCPQVWSVPALRDKWINLREYAFRSNGSGISNLKQDMTKWTGL